MSKREDETSAFLSEANRTCPDRTYPSESLATHEQAEDEA